MWIPMVTRALVFKRTHLTSRMVSTTYGMVAVIQTTLPLDFTPLNREM